MYSWTPLFLFLPPQHWLCQLSSGLNVTIDGQPLDVNSFVEYVSMFGPPKNDRPPLYIRPNQYWEIVVGASADSKFQQVSFVNSISTLRGGTHVNIMVEQLCRRIADFTNRTHGKTIGTPVTPAQVRGHLKLFVSALIKNPSFDSQLKESLTTPTQSFGSNPMLSERFTKLVIQESGIVESLVDWALAKERVQFLGKMKTSTSKSSKRLIGIPKLEDANDAGDSDMGRDCTLILTEGDSAKALAVAGLAVVGRDKYGVFPLRGKPLNVRDASLAQIGGNAEICNLIQILGLDYNKTYCNDEDYQTLRYGSIMMMADQDHDGSHIKGLLLNTIHCLFPALLERENFVKAFITPIVKAKRKRKKKTPTGSSSSSSDSNEHIFYTLAKYEEWRERTFQATNEAAAAEDTADNWNIKYYKGLGTSTAEEARVYFSALDSHVKPFAWGGPQDGERLDMAFRKNRAEDRKQWLSNSSSSSSNSNSSNSTTAPPLLTAPPLTPPPPPTATTTAGEATTATAATTMSAFVDNELVLFSHADNIRSIPSLVDGLKPSQRKVLYACFKRKLINNEIKVAQLAGYVSEHTAYHHGEASLQSTITNMAQDFVGSNNLPLLYPSGQFGTRLQGGKDAASPRYIFTKLMPAARKLFPVEDDPLLMYRDDDGFVVEPMNYVPVIPMALVNGCDGIGTGWSTSVPMYNPMDLIDWLEHRINQELNEDTKDKKDKKHKKTIQPWVRGFTGTIVETSQKGKYKSTGIVTQLNTNTLEITELPVGRWTDDMKKVLGALVSDNTVKGYREHHTEDRVHFVINMTRNKLAQFNESTQSTHGFEKLFKLEEMINTTNMHLFNARGSIQKYNTVEDILEEYYPVRREMYAKRRLYQLKQMKTKLDRLANKARFLTMVSSGTIVLVNRNKIDLENDLIHHQFVPENNLKGGEEGGEGEEGEEGGEKEEQSGSSTGKAKKNVGRSSSPRANFDYLLRTPLSSITLDNVEAGEFGL